MRLNRERNNVMHGNRVDERALIAVLRVTAPLIGAGFDRIAHAALERGVDPMPLAAQAALGIQLADSRTAPDLCDVLE